MLARFRHAVEFRAGIGDGNAVGGVVDVPRAAEEIHGLADRRAGFAGQAEHDGVDGFNAQPVVDAVGGDIRLQGDILLDQFQDFRHGGFEAETDADQAAGLEPRGDFLVPAVGPGAALERKLQLALLDAGAQLEDVFAVERQGVIDEIDVVDVPLQDDLFQFLQDMGQAAPAQPFAVQVVGAIHAAEGAAPGHLNGGVSLPAARGADGVEVVAQQVAGRERGGIQVHDAGGFGSPHDPAVFAGHDPGHPADGFAAGKPVQEFREGQFAFPDEQVIEGLGEGLFLKDRHMLAADDHRPVGLRLEKTGHFLNAVEEGGGGRHADEIRLEGLHAPEHRGEIQLFDLRIDQLHVPAGLLRDRTHSGEVQRREGRDLVGHAGIDAERIAPGREDERQFHAQREWPASSDGSESAIAVKI